MSLANDIISRRMPDFDKYLKRGDSLDDLDEYGFTPLIEAAITRQTDIAEALLKRGVNVNKPDPSGRTPLHWAVDNNDLELAKLLLRHNANPNAYTRAAMPVLAFPVLRSQDKVKHLLYQHGARLDFAQDFIQAKLIGHRFELQGDVDIVNAEGEFIEVDYEGFILEFTVAILKDSLRRFTSSFSTRHLRDYFPAVHKIMDAFDVAADILKLQHHAQITDKERTVLKHCLDQELQIYPVASRGHAFSFIRFHQWLAKIDRGENSLKEGSVNIYRITRPDEFDVNFLQNIMLRKQSRGFFHQQINQILGLMPLAQLPMTTQIAGNCSWANIQAIVPVAYTLLQLKEIEHVSGDEGFYLYDEWLNWDQDRALEQCLHRFYLIDEKRKASYASMLGGVIFQALNYERPHDVERAEKILEILTKPEYYYILDSYLEEYCIKRLTRRGNNLLKLMDDCGYNPNIGVSPIATGLRERSTK